MLNTRRVLFLLSTLLIAAGFVGVVEGMMPIFPDQSPSIFGQDHKYSVTLRGNGEAVVSARIAFTNTAESSMSALLLRLPNAQVSDVFVYQMKRTRYCNRYGPATERLDEASIQDSLMPALEQDVYPQILRPYQPEVCVEYAEPDYYQPWWGGTTEYRRAPAEIRNDTIAITLPESVSSNASGAVLLYYRSHGFIDKKMFGVYEYAFETLKTEDRIRTVQVGVMTDSDYVLKGRDVNVNYRFPEMSSSAVGMTADSASAFKNSSLDMYAQEIGMGMIVKTASDLQPLDSFTVTGSYAKSRLALYSKSIVIGVIGILLLIVVAGIIIRILYKHFFSSPVAVDDSLPPAPLTPSLKTYPLAAVVGIGFLSSLLMLFQTGILFVIWTALSPQYSYWGMLLFIGVVSVSVIVFVLIIFVPAWYLGTRYGHRYGIFVLLTVILLFVVYLLIAYAVIMLMTPSSMPPIITPYMMKAEPSVMMQESFMQ